MLGVLGQHVAFASVLDVGCGMGALLSAAVAGGVGDVMGVDGPWVDPELLAFDPARFRGVDLNEAFDLGRSFDLTVSIEAGQRVRPASAAALVRSIARHGGTVLFSTALPGQGGADHVNECWPETWAGLFDAEGFDAFDVVRQGVWGDARVEPWAQQNALLFLRRGLPVPESLEPYRVVGEPATLVHRTTYNRALRRIEQLKKEVSDRRQAAAGAGPPTDVPATPAGSGGASFHDRISRQASAPEVADIIVGRLRSGTPLSLIRLSHCESKFLNWPDVFEWAEINKSLRRRCCPARADEPVRTDVRPGRPGVPPERGRLRKRARHRRGDGRA